MLYKYANIRIKNYICRNILAVIEKVTCRPIAWRALTGSGALCTHMLPSPDDSMNGVGRATQEAKAELRL